jgi:hypothetical protein
MEAAMTKSKPSGAEALRPEFISPLITGLLTAIGLLAAIYAVVHYPETALPLQAKIFMVAWLALSIACTFLLMPRSFTAGFLTGLLCMLIGWRTPASTA